MSEDIPDPIRKFVAANIASIVQLEALLLLREQSAPLSSAEVARRLYCQPEMMDRQLRALKTAGLLGTPDGQLDQYLYRPASEEVARLVDELADVYRNRRVAMTTLIYSDSNYVMRKFSDAFRIREDKS